MNIILIQILVAFQFLRVNLSISKNAQDLIKNKEKEEIEELVDLNDSVFDSIIQNGNNNRWIILFYLDYCIHCARAKKILNQILKSKIYTNVNNIKFGSVDIENNQKTKIRFNVSKVPNIILVENNNYIEYDLYVNEKNIVEFIRINFTNNTNGIKPFPKYNIFKYFFALFENSLIIVTEEANKYLESKNIKIKLTSLQIILIYIFICFFFSILIIFSVQKFFKIKMDKLIKNKKKYTKVKEIGKVNDLNENKNELPANINDSNEDKEKSKKMRKDTKENEHKEKKIKESKKDNIKEIKKEIKKKKE